MILPQEILDDCFEQRRNGLFAQAEGQIRRPDSGDMEGGQLRRLYRTLGHRLRDFAADCAAREPVARTGSLDPASRRDLAECYARAGSIDVAISIYRDLARDEDCPTDLLPAVASGLGGLGDYRAALDVCREIVRRDPGHHHAHFGVAFYRRRLGESPYAVLPAMIRAHELAPEIPLYRISLAVLLDAIGWREDACDLLRDLDPGAVPCRCCLQKAMAIFLAAGDAPRGEACRSEASGMTSVQP